MGVHPDTFKFGLVAVVGIGIYVVGVFTVDPVAITGTTTGIGQVFAPFRQIGGVLVIAAVAGWLASRLTTNAPY